MTRPDHGDIPRETAADTYECNIAASRIVMLLTSRVSSCWTYEVCDESCYCVARSASSSRENQSAKKILRETLQQCEMEDDGINRVIIKVSKEQAVVVQSTS